MVELVSELEVNTGFVDRRFSKHGLVNTTASGEGIVPSILGKEYLDSERLVDACGLERDVGERRVTGPVLMETFKRGNDEPSRLVLDGDRACELCPSRGEFCESLRPAGPPVELGERSRDTAVLIAGEAHDFSAEVRELPWSWSSTRVRRIVPHRSSETAFGN